MDKSRNSNSDGERARPGCHFSRPRGKSQLAQKLANIDEGKSLKGRPRGRIQLRPRAGVPPIFEVRANTNSK